MVRKGPGSAGSLRSRCLQPTKLRRVIKRTAVRAHPRVWSHCHETIIVFHSSNRETRLNSIESDHAQQFQSYFHLTHMRKRRLRICGSFDNNIDSYCISLCLPLWDYMPQRGLNVKGKVFIQLLTTIFGLFWDVWQVSGPLEWCQCTIQSLKKESQNCCNCGKTLERECSV